MHEANSTPGEKTDTKAKARRVPSQYIFAGEKQVYIEHGDAEYLLRITRQGKLILTK